MNTGRYKITATVSGIVTAVICAVMNFILIPAIENGALTRCFDMNFGYSYTDALRFLSSISENGLNVYLKYQLPLDFIYPIAYCIFFCSLFILLEKKKSSLLILPVMLAFFDYVENVMTLIMLIPLHGVSFDRAAEMSKLPRIDFISFSSTATMFKTVLMYLCFLLTLILVFKRIANSIKKKKESNG